jgi:hypothetical protein
MQGKKAVLLSLPPIFLGKKRGVVLNVRLPTKTTIYQRMAQLVRQPFEHSLQKKIHTYFKYIAQGQSDLQL